MVPRAGPWTIGTSWLDDRTSPRVIALPVPDLMARRTIERLPPEILPPGDCVALTGSDTSQLLLARNMS